MRLNFRVRGFKYRLLLETKTIQVLKGDSRLGLYWSTLSPIEKVKLFEDIKNV